MPKKPTEANEPNIEQLASSDFELKTRKAKILCLDIENTPTIAAVWQKYQADTVWVHQPSYMLSWSAKWLNGKQITRALCDYDDYDPANPNDKRLVTELYNLLDGADVCVAHNGNKFDFPMIRGRFLQHGLNPSQPFAQVDTLRISKRSFRLFSHKLDDLGEFLGVGRKVSTGGYSLWHQCMQGDRQAWKLMKKYNAQDTRLLERVYLKLRSWDDQHPNMNLLLGTTDNCPKCGGTELIRKGSRRSRVGVAVRWQCTSCGGFSQTAYKKQVDLR